MTMKDRKQAVLNEILTAYETYQGRKKSKLEERLTALRQSGKLPPEEYEKLTVDLAADRQHVFGILANSWRVRVSFDNRPASKPQDTGNYPFADLDKLFEPLPDLDDFDLDK